MPTSRDKNRARTPTTPTTPTQKSHSEQRRLLAEMPALARGNSWREQPKYPINVSELLRGFRASNSVRTSAQPSVSCLAVTRPGEPAKDPLRDLQWPCTNS